MFKKFQVHILALSKNETYNESAFSRDDHLYLGGNKHDRLFKETIESFRQNF